MVANSERRQHHTRIEAKSDEESPLQGFKAAIVGGGPSGLLLAHKLLQKGAAVHVFEGRKDPRSLGDLEGRAYALGLGMRARSAIRSVANSLWDAVKARGYESERFTLYLRTLPVKLRDGSGDESLEPSVLMYQSDLCAALLDDLEHRHSTGKLSLEFTKKIASCDLKKNTLILETNEKRGPYDIIVGCDGVNSVVRSSIDEASPAFSCEKNALPGEFKVCRVLNEPPKLDPSSVALIVPKAGSTTAFVEPTASGSCILFAGRGGQDDVLLNPPANLTITALEIERRFPILAGVDFDDIANQLATQKSGSASSVQCNAYHYRSCAALCGDAAHATGGVSGQGVNSAFVDSEVLGDCLAQHFNATDRKESLSRALLVYSQRQVPEGKALYDLSFGPNPDGVLRVKFLVSNVLDTLFKGRHGIGKPPLQTLLTTSVVPFAEVRRERDQFYDGPFPTQATFDYELAKIYQDESVETSI